jgi:hypothetical protein
MLSFRLIGFLDSFLLVFRFIGFAFIYDQQCMYFFCDFFTTFTLFVKKNDSDISFID